jgi:hypothetical protein
VVTYKETYRPVLRFPRGAQPGESDESRTRKKMEFLLTYNAFFRGWVGDGAV